MIMGKASIHLGIETPCKITWRKESFLSQTRVVPSTSIQQDRQGFGGNKGCNVTRKELAESIYKVSHLTGRFKLRSGSTSDEYFDKYRFEALPQLLKEIAIHLVPLIPKNSEVLAGLDMGGLPIATVLSMETGLPTAFIRKEAKNYGTCRLAEGVEIKGQRLCLIEDVITTGGQVIDSTKSLRKEGAIVNDVVCVIYRGNGPPQKILNMNLNYHPLFTMDELKSVCNHSGEC